MNRIILTKGIVYDWSTLGDMEIDNKDNLHTSESMLQDALFNLKGKKVKLILEVGNDEYEEISELKHVASLLLSTQQDCVRLQKQLSSIKTLDRGEVEKIFDEELPDSFDYEEEKRYTMSKEKNIIDAICKLGIEPIERGEE